MALIRRIYARFRRSIIAVFQIVVVCFSLITAFLLRFEFTIPPSEIQLLWTGMGIAVVAKVLAFRFMGCDRAGWRYTSIPDLMSLLAANMAGSAFFTGAALLWIGPAFPRSVYCIDFLVCFLATSAAKLSVRLYYESISKDLVRSGRRRVLIYGCGAAGLMLLREIRTNPSLRYHVVGFLDDNTQKVGMNVMGTMVLGRGRDAALIVDRLRKRRSRIDEIIIALPSASGQQMREALANSRVAGVPCKTVPGVGQLLSGKVLSSQIRDVSVVDLLGREPVSLDESLIRASIAGRSVMVTGAGGSIGSELCRQIARFEPECLVLFDQAESDLYRIQLELECTFASIRSVPQIGDIRDYDRVEEVIRRYSVESIFHAAAYKHVPMMESHVLEAVQNNVLGTRNLVLAASRNRVADFLMISSDKAVNPTNVMGTTKRVAELIVSSQPLPSDGGRTKFVSVRFGNVLGSNGSVIPLFKEQIAAGGPVTVTHPEMRRYFMTIPEAVQLVLQASTMGKGSEIFVLDMGEPVRIVDLARNMIQLSGREPEVDIEIRFIGLRPGEKLFEELITKGENILSTYHNKIKIFAGSRLNRKRIEEWTNELQELVAERDEVAIIEHLIELVPEYQPSGYWQQPPDQAATNKKGPRRAVAQEPWQAAANETI